MAIQLPEELHREIDQHVQSGGYATREDAIRAGLAALDELNAQAEFDPGEWNALLAEGERSAQQQGLVSARETFDRLMRRVPCRRPLRRHGWERAASGGFNDGREIRRRRRSAGMDSKSIRSGR